MTALVVTAPAQPSEAVEVAWAEHSRWLLEQVRAYAEALGCSVEVEHGS